MRKIVVVGEGRIIFVNCENYFDRLYESPWINIGNFTLEERLQYEVGSLSFKFISGVHLCVYSSKKSTLLTN